MEPSIYAYPCLFLFYTGLCLILVYLVGFLPYYISKRIKADNVRDAQHYQSMIHDAMIIVICTTLLVLVTTFFYDPWQR